MDINKERGITVAGDLISEPMYVAEFQPLYANITNISDKPIDFQPEKENLNSSAIAKCSKLPVPYTNPANIKAPIKVTFKMVRTFWIRVPKITPLEWIKVKNRITNIAVSFLNNPEEINSEENSNFWRDGSASARYSEKPMAEAAIGAEKPTINDNHPLKNPSRGLNSFDIKMYSPPACGKVAPSSPKASAPQKAIIPPANQSDNMIIGFARLSIIKPVVVKIPAPMIFATTIFVTGKSPSFLGNLSSELLNYLSLIL